MRTQLQSLARHSAVYTVGNVLNKALYFILVPLYTRLLTQDEYGSFALLHAGLMVLLVVYELGASSSVMRLYYDFEDDVQRRRFVGSIWMFTLAVTATLSLVLTLAGRWFLAPLFGGVAFMPYVVLIVWSAFLGTASVIPLVLLRIHEQSRRFALLILGQTLLLLVTTAVLLAVFHLGLAGAVWATVLQTGVFFLIYSIYTWRHATPSLSVDFIRRSMAYGLPVVVLQGGWWVLSTSDRFLLGHFSTLDVVALYNVGYVLGKGLQMVSQSINQAWTPFFFKTVKEGDPESHRMFSYTATYFALLLCFLGLVLIAFSREAVLILGGPKYLDATRVTQVVVLASIAQGMFYVPSRGLFLQKKTAYFPVIVGISGALNVGLNLVVIPRYGMMGAAWSTVAGYLMALGLTYVLSQHWFPIRYDVKRLAHLAAVFVMLALAVRLVDGGSVAAFLARLAIVAAFPVGLLATNFFEPAETRALRQAGSRLLMRVVPSRHGAA